MKETTHLIKGISEPPALMTEEEFEAWCDEDIKAEYVDGEVIVHSPVAVEHTRLDRFLIALMQMVAEYNNSGEVFGPEFQVRLRPGLRRVPDAMFVSTSRLAMVKKTYVEGAPDMILEIVSADSVERDWRQKYLEYEAAGVKEYWIVDPNTMQLRAYRLQNKRYRPLPEEKSTLTSHVLTGFHLEAAWLWQEPPPPLLTVAAKLGLIPSRKPSKRRRQKR